MEPAGQQRQEPETNQTGVCEVNAQPTHALSADDNATSPGEHRLSVMGPWCPKGMGTGTVVKLDDKGPAPGRVARRGGHDCDLVVLER